jgi:type IV pilus assembly protein PilV
MHPMKRTPDTVTSPAGHFGNRQQGFTLLEVLIALLILSIGLLGLAALQTTGLRSNEMASMRTTATMLAYDISDRMRANPQGTINGEYVKPLSSTIPDCTSDSSTGCSPAELATFDLSQWGAALTQLPGGQGDISPAAGTPLIHTITVRWDENRTGADKLNCPPLNSDDLRCIRLVLSE